MSKRLRHQEVTVKPRIIARDGLFEVEYLGKALGKKCVMPTQTFSNAVAYANMVARRNPDEIRAINTRRDQARHIRRAAKLGLQVAA